VREADKDIRKLSEKWSIENSTKQYIVSGQNGRSRCTLCSVGVARSCFHINIHLAKPSNEKKAKSAECHATPLSCFCQPLKADPNIEKLTLGKNVRRAELMLSRFIARRNVAIDIIDELPEILKTCFLDFGVAKNLTCGRTKTKHLVNDVIGEVGFEDLCEIIKKQKFTIIVDDQN